MGSSRRDRTGQSSCSVSSIRVVLESSRRDRRFLKSLGSKDRKSRSLDSRMHHVTKYKNCTKFVLAKMISWILLFMVPWVLLYNFLILGVKPFTVEYNILK